MSKVLFIEAPTEATAILLNCVQRALRWKVVHAPAFGDPLTDPNLQGDVKALIVTLGSNCSEASRYLSDFKEAAALRGIVSPSVVVLSPFRQRPDWAARFERLGATYLLRAYPDQTCDVLKKLEWQDRVAGGRVTLIIQRTAGHVAGVRLQIGSQKIPLRLGPRLRAFIEHLALNARTEHTTEMLADALGIQAQCVKEYLFRLRRVLDDVFGEACVPVRGEDVIWTSKVPGGFLHGLHANIVFDDLSVARETPRGL